MKRYVKIIIAAVLLLVSVAAGSVAFAETEGLVPEAGEAFLGKCWVVSVKAEGESIRGVRADFEAKGLSLDAVIPGNESRPVISNESRVLVYSDISGGVIQSGDVLFSFSLYVPEDMPEGTEVSLALKNIVFSDGVQDKSVSDVTISATVKEPASEDAMLSGIDFNGEGITDFLPEVREYSFSVPFETKSAEIIPYTEDDEAYAEVSCPERLIVGENRAIITVTSESGNTAQYTLIITREQKITVYPENEARLKAISTENGIISPQFNRDIEKYILYVPFEAKYISITGTPLDPEADCIDVFFQPEEGANEVDLVCKAVDGVTEKKYHITVFRLPEFEGKAPVITQEPEETPVPSPTPSVEPSPTPDNGEIHSHSDNFFEFAKEATIGVSLLTLIIIFILIIILLGLIIAFFAITTKKNKGKSDAEAQEEGK